MRPTCAAMSANKSTSSSQWHLPDSYGSAFYDQLMILAPPLVFRLKELLMTWHYNITILPS